MIRTQISLDAKEYALAKKAARKQGISVAELVRTSLRASLPVKSDRPWMRFAGIVTTEGRHSNYDIDEVVYGLKD